METINALLVFCEGPHDVAFCRLVFKYCFDIPHISWKFSEYPAPLNQLFKTSMEKHAAQDMSLDMAHKFFLPDRTIYSEEKKNLILLFNTGGKTKTENPKNFLRDFLPLLKNSKIFPGGADKVIKNCKYLFLYDRDHRSPSDLFSWCKNEFACIGDEIFIAEDFCSHANNSLAASCMGNTIGMYAFSKPAHVGTLEDILVPMFEAAHPELVRKGEGFLDDCFTWKAADGGEKTRVAKVAARKKALITVIGQGEKPGFSMNVIVDQAKLISKEIFSNNDDVKRFVNFITSLAEFLR